MYGIIRKYMYMDKIEVDVYQEKNKEEYKTVVALLNGYDFDIEEDEGHTEFNYRITVIGKEYIQTIRLKDYKIQTIPK